MIRIPKTRAVITGLGIVAPGGNDLTSFWHSVTNQISGVGPITLFDTSDIAAKAAGEVKDFNIRSYLGADVRPSRLARQTQFAMAAAKMAVADARIDLEKYVGNNPLHVVLGVSYSALDVVERQIEIMYDKGCRRLSPYTVEASTPHTSCSAIGKLFDVETQITTVSSGCAAGLDAIASAVDMIQAGRCEVAICGGTDSPLTKFAFACFANAGMTSTSTDDPKTVSRPYDVNADSGVVSEGCGILVVETLDRALARGARIYAEITGFSTSVDKNPDLPASGMGVCMQRAMNNAGLRPKDIDYINAHGPGLPIIDIIETEQIKEVFKEQARRIPVSSVKGVIGNPMAGAGPIQLITTCLAMQKNCVPPTTNCLEKHPRCDLDNVIDGPRYSDIRTSMVNSHNMGGGNSTMIIRKLTD